MALAPYPGNTLYYYVASITVTNGGSGYHVYGVDAVDNLTGLPQWVEVSIAKPVTFASNIPSKSPIFNDFYQPIDYSVVPLYTNPRWNECNLYNDINNALAQVQLFSTSVTRCKQQNCYPVSFGAVPSMPTSSGIRTLGFSSHTMDLNYLGSLWEWKAETTMNYYCESYYTAAPLYLTQLGYFNPGATPLETANWTYPSYVPKASDISAALKIRNIFGNFVCTGNPGFGDLKNNMMGFQILMDTVTGIDMSSVCLMGSFRNGLMNVLYKAVYGVTMEDAIASVSAGTPIGIINPTLI